MSGLKSIQPQSHGVLRLLILLGQPFASLPTPHTVPPTLHDPCCRAGKQYNTVREVQVLAGAGDAAPGASFFQSSGVRKAVVLARLVDALQAW